MIRCTSYAKAHVRTLVWMLTLAVLTMTLTPLHFHLHHDGDGATAQTHTVDLHSVVQQDDPHHDQAGHTVDSGAKATHKSGYSATPFVALILTLVLIVARSGQTMVPGRRRDGDTLPDPCWSITPPLRGPPRT